MPRYPRSQCGVAALLAVAVGGCTTASSQADAPLALGVEGPEPPFETMDEYAVAEDGTTDLLELPLGPERGALVVRVSPGSPSPGVCYQVDSVTDADGRAFIPPAVTQADWGPYCTTCEQRASVGHGYGLFVFSNNGDPLPESSVIKLRVTLRDCITKLPLNDLSGVEAPDFVRVESLRTPAAPEPTAEGRLELFFAFAENTQFSSATAGDDPTLAAARAALGAIFEGAGIAVDVAGYADFDAGADRAVFSDADRGPLDALYQRAYDARRDAGHDPGSTLVIFAPCLIEEDALLGMPSRPDGLVPRLPGGFSREGYADAIFIKASGCDPGSGSSYWPFGAPLGKVIAHEVGHYLGLYHSVEASGQEDHLDDTGAENLMFHTPLLASAEGLSARQISVLRSHPGVSFAR